MKRYKLLKDLPTSKAGDIFYISEAGDLFHESEDLLAYTNTILEKFPNILTDWFEEIEEPTRWKPEMSQTYCYINTDGSVYGTTWTDDYFDDGRFEIGNCFQTKEEAERVVEYLKALAVVRGDVISKFTKGEQNWYVYYDSYIDFLDTDHNYANIKNGIFGLPYFATEEDAQRSIELHKKEWLTIFGVGEEE